jgi:hypothetical protein
MEFIILNLNFSTIPYKFVLLNNGCHVILLYQSGWNKKSQNFKYFKVIL